MRRIIFDFNSIRQASGILIVTLLLSNVLGVIRDHYLAQKIPTDRLDIYYAAFRLPDLIFNLLILGAIAAAFIPIFTTYRLKKEKEAWEIANSIINIALLSLIFLATLFFFLMPLLIPLIVPAFSPEKQIQVTYLSRIMLLTPIFFGISYIFGGILNSYHRFFIYSLTPLVYNLSIIIFTILLADRLGVWAPTFGVLVGAGLHMSIQYPVVRKVGWRYHPVLNYLHPGVRKIGKLMIPRSIGLAANQILLLAFTALASGMTGAIAVFNLANNIQTMPTVVFGSSLATAIFPILSQTASLGEKEQFSNYLIRTMRIILFILIPTTLGVILLRAQIVRLVLGSGYFGWTQTIQTYQTLAFFSISLVAQGLIPLFARAFYAFHNTLTPAILGIIGVLISIILGWIFVSPLGVAGLALAFSIGSFIQVISLYIILLKQLPFLFDPKIFISIGKMVLATGVMVVFVQLTKYRIGSLVDMDRVWGVLTQTILAMIIGIVFYLITTWALRCEEIRLIFLRRWHEKER